MPIIKFSPTERRRLSLFAVCLAFAIGAWLFFAFSNSYIYKTQTAVRFVDYPQNKAFNSLQSDTVTLEIEGTGWQLLFSRLRISPQSVDVSLRDLSKRAFIDLSSQLKEINAQFSSTQRIVRIQPDTLYFDFAPRETKRVPVKLISNLQFVKQYGISDSIRLIPSYVTISGPREDLANISFWETDTLRQENVNGTIQSTIAFRKPDRTNVTIYPRNVTVTVPVDEFTEKSLELPVRVINNRDYLDVRLLPERVKVTFMTSLGAYAKVDRSDFSAVVDLEQWSRDSYKQLPVRLTEIPAFCTVIRTEPQNLDFIIRR